MVTHHVLVKVSLQSYVRHDVVLWNLGFGCVHADQVKTLDHSSFSKIIIFYN